MPLDYMLWIKYIAWEVCAPKGMWLSANTCAEAPDAVM